MSFQQDKGCIGAATVPTSRPGRPRRAPVSREKQVADIEAAIKLEADICRAGGQSLEAMQANVEALRANLAALAGTGEALPPARELPPIDDFRALCEGRGALLRSLVDRVEVHPEGCRLYFHQQFGQHEPEAFQRTKRRLGTL